MITLAFSNLHKDLDEKKSQYLGSLSHIDSGRLPHYKNQSESSGFFVKLIVFMLICGAGLALTLAFESWWLRGLGIVIMGVMFAHAAELQHECLHNSAFKKPWLNRLVGFFLGLPNLLFILTIAIAICLVTESWSGFIIWLASLLLVAEPVHSLIELPEHVGCPRDSINPHKNTRTIKGSWFSFWLTNGNNFHVEHHKHPSAAINQLPLIHETDPKGHEHMHRSYFDFYKTFFLEKEITNHASKLNKQNNITEE